MHNHSEQLGELAPAMLIAQAELKPALKDSVNPHFRSKYAGLQSVWDAAKGPLAKAGLSVVQTFQPSDHGVTVCTTLLHKSGQWISSCLTLRPTKDDPQGVGSAITYGRRYGLSAILGIVADEDDDGNAVSAPTQHLERAPRQEVSVPRDPKPYAAHGWKDCPIHFGKNKGKKLGELPENTLEWYINEWQPKPYNGKISEDDQALRNALDEAQNAKQPMPAGAQDNDEDAPF